VIGASTVFRLHEGTGMISAVIPVTSVFWLNKHAESESAWTHLPMLPPGFATLGSIKASLECFFSCLF
jgi:hypothetical protein